MRHRPGWEWLLAALAACLLAAAAIVVMMALMRPADAADGLKLRPGELDLLVKVVAAESTGEPADGQRAVAWVVANRLYEGTFGKSITRVLLAPHQFAKPIPLADNSPAYLKAMLATVQVVLGTLPDPSLGSTYFYRKDMRPPPHWAKHMEKRIILGNHVFLRPVD